MKKIILILVTVLLSTFVYAQVDNYNGSQHLSVGANFFGNKENIKVVYHHGISNMFSVGVGAYVLNDSYAFVRGDFYLNSVIPLPDNLSVYGGVELGVLGIDFLNFDPQIGVAYSISKNLDLFIEAGNTGTLGVSFSF
ncbi:MAG: hypothetical protein Q8J84_03660 [Flavobacteriaceae bacterium]|nr:hypothetical protein [Flavobacteriaceae bacterium]